MTVPVPALSPLGRAAVAYARQGWPVFPLVPRGKRPLIDGGFHQASTDEATVHGWWARWPDANIGASPGACGYVVIDLDGPAGVDAAQHLGLLAEPTLEVVTGREDGGRHQWYRLPDASPHIPNGKLAAGIDVRGHAGYVVLPPSVHETGKTYTWHGKLAEALPAPGWILSHLAKMPRPDGAPASRPTGDGPLFAKLPAAEIPAQKIISGGRNEMLSRYAGRLFAQGMGLEEATLLVRALNTTNCVPPLDQGEVDRLCQSIHATHTRNRAAAGLREVAAAGAEAVAPTPGDDAPDGFACTEMGLGDRLRVRHGAKLRYVSAWGRWYLWDGAHWVPDAADVVTHLAGETVRAVAQAAHLATDAARKAELTKFARAAQRQSVVKGALAFARCEPDINVHHVALDADPALLSCESGLIDLRTGALRPHDPTALCTMHVPIAYDPAATAPRWGAFLEECWPEPSVRDFLWRAVGYSLTGLTIEQCLIVMNGVGRNGKSTFLEVLLELAGSYGTPMAVQSLLDRGSDTGVRNDLARLVGKRCVVMGEPNEGKRLDEGLVKLLTGGDKILARFLHQEFFEYRPAFTPWMATNHLPVIRGADDGIWRRLRVVPCTVRIPEHAIDRTLKDQLVGELPGIFAWAIAGAVAWFAGGLPTPRAIADATASYRSEQDTLGSFLAERTTDEPAAWVQASALYQAYKRWADEAGEFCLTQTAFGRRLTDRGYRVVKDGDGNKRRYGLKLNVGA